MPFVIISVIAFSKLWVIDFSIDAIRCSIADILDYIDVSVMLLLVERPALAREILDALASLLFAGVVGLPNVDTESVSSPVTIKFNLDSAKSSAEDLR